MHSKFIPCILINATIRYKYSTRLSGESTPGFGTTEHQARLARCRGIALCKSRTRGEVLVILDLGRVGKSFACNGSPTAEMGCSLPVVTVPMPLPTPLDATARHGHRENKAYRMFCPCSAVENMGLAGAFRICVDASLFLVNSTKALEHERKTPRSWCSALQFP